MSKKVKPLKQIFYKMPKISVSAWKCKLSPKISRFSSMNEIESSPFFIYIIKSRAEPRLLLRQETDVKCPWNIWSSRSETAGLSSGWGGTWSSPRCLKQESHSAGAPRWEPSASLLLCNISSPASEACTWEKQINK